MTLLQIQQRMSHAIFQPLTAADRLDPITDAAFIKPNARLSSRDRLEIYSRSYWFRILDSFYDDFPGLRAVLGERAFHRLSRAYLAACPSRSFTLRNLGSRLEEWLRRNPAHTGNRHDIALDMVRLEWAHIEAFDSNAGKVLGPEDLVELGPDFHVQLQPHIRLLAIHHPVDDMRIQVNLALDERGVASNTALKQRHREITKRVSQSKPNQIFLAIHRRNFMVYYRRIDAEEYRLLSALGDGSSIGEAIQCAFEGSSAAIAERQAMLETWFTAWAELGWLCLPARREEERQLQ
jgi:hypothetical protein